MRFLLDVCVSSRSLTESLIAQGHDVVSAIAIDARSTDEQLLAIALADDRVLVTEDKDFGEIMFVQARPHGPVVRLVELSVDQQVQAIGELLEQHTSLLSGPVIVTISAGRMRFRRQGP